MSGQDIGIYPGASSGATVTTTVADIVLGGTPTVEDLRMFSLDLSGKVNITVKQTAKVLGIQSFGGELAAASTGAVNDRGVVTLNGTNINGSFAHGFEPDADGITKLGGLSVFVTKCVANDLLKCRRVLQTAAGTGSFKESDGKTSLQLWAIPTGWPVYMLERTSAQNLTSSFATLAWNSVTNAETGYSNSSGAITVPTAGWKLIQCNVLFRYNTTGTSNGINLRMRLTLDGAEVTHSLRRATAPASTNENNTNVTLCILMPVQFTTTNQVLRVEVGQTDANSTEVWRVTQNASLLSIIEMSVDPLKFRYTNSAVQGSDAAFSVGFDTEDEEDSPYTHSTSSNTNQVTFAAGRYLVGFMGDHDRGSSTSTTKLAFDARFRSDPGGTPTDIVRGTGYAYSHGKVSTRLLDKSSIGGFAILDLASSTTFEVRHAPLGTGTDSAFELTGSGAGLILWAISLNDFPGNETIKPKSQVQSEAKLRASDHASLQGVRTQVQPEARLRLSAQAALAPRSQVLLEARTLAGMPIALSLNMDAVLRAYAVGGQAFALRAKSLVKLYTRAEAAAAIAMRVKSQTRLTEALKMARRQTMMGFSQTLSDDSIGIPAAEVALPARSEVSATARIRTSFHQALIPRSFAWIESRAKAFEVLDKYPLYLRSLILSDARARISANVAFPARSLAELTSWVRLRTPIGFYEATSSLVRSRLLNLWAVPNGVSVQYDNLPYIPASSAVRARASVVYGRRDSDTIQLSTLGADLVAFGELETVLFSPVQYGIAAARALADALADKFRIARIQWVMFDEPSVEQQGLRGSDYQMLVRCPFYAYDNRDALQPVAPDVGFDGEFLDTATAIRAYFSTVLPGTPVQYDGLPFERPIGTPWVRFTIRDGGSFVTSQGATRRAGVAVADVRVPASIGEKPALALVDAIDDVLRIVDVQGVSFSGPTVGRGRLDGDEWLVPITCPWTSESWS